MTKLLEGSSSWLKTKFLINISGMIILCSDNDLDDESNGLFEEREVLLLEHR